MRLVRHAHWLAAVLFNMLLVSLWSAAAGLSPMSTKDCFAADAIGPDEGLPRVAWQEARKAVGKTAIVFGQLKTIGHTKRIHFLDFHESDRAAFKAVVFDEALQDFPNGIDQYKDQYVAIRGPVTTYNNNPQIVVGKPSQIRVLTKDTLPEPYWPDSPAQVPVGDEIKVASFNVENLFDSQDDPYRNDDSSPAKSRVELEKLAEMIRSVDADVLALQEVESRGYLQRFIDVLIPNMGYRHLVHYEGNDNRGIDVCVLSRVPVGPVMSYRHLRFQDANGEWRKFQRDLLRVTLEPTGGESFEAWVLHLKSNHGGREAAEPIRIAEASKVRELIDEELMADPKAQFFVCGDFNDTYDSKTVQALRGTNSAPQQRLHCFCQQSKVRVSYNREPYLEMIDFILCSPQFAKRFVAGSYQIQDATGTSDHNPVTAVFRKNGY